MFAHIYSYRIKCIIRDKQTMFWTLLFPILLAILFQMSLSNITKVEVFKEIDIAVVDNAQNKDSNDFQAVLASVSGKNDNDKLFNVKYTSKDEAENLLKDNKIEGYIYLENGIQLIVKKSGLNQTIIKGFLDDYKQTTSTVTNILKENPSALQNGLINDISNRKEYLNEITTSKSAPNTTVHYFYTLIAMACLYGGFLGLKEVMAIQANQTTQGARVNLAPTHKLKVFFVSILAAVTVQFLVILILLLFLIFALQIDFGNQLGYIILTCIAGSFTGVTFGTFIAVIVKKGEGVKIGLLIAGSLTMSFLSGMMYSGIKLIVNQKAPILGYLNPANLIADSFYSLYFYNNHAQYFTNLSLLCGFTILFSFITYIVLRRQKYASI